MTVLLEREVSPLAIPEELAVTVRPEHIARGERGNSHHCAISLAFKEVIPSDWVIAMGNSGWMHMRLPSIDERQVYVCEDAALWVQRFDCGENVEPERFVFRRWDERGFSSN